MDVVAADTIGSVCLVLFCLAMLYWLYLKATGQDPDQVRKRRIAELAKANANRGYVVYLRSFVTESRRFRGQKFSDPFVAKNLVGTGEIGRNVGHQVTQVLKAIGTPVELSRRGAKPSRMPGMPELPKQEFAGDEEWQQHVLGWLPKALVVVVQLDISRGLGWELGEVVRRVDPIKVVLVLPPTQKEYAEVSSWAHQYFPVAFPATLPDSRLMTFAAGWQPRPLKANADLLFTLKPVFDANGYEAPVRTAAEEKQARAAKAGR